MPDRLTLLFQIKRRLDQSTIGASLRPLLWDQHVSAQTL